MYTFLMNEQQYLKILELLREKDSVELGKEMMLSFRKELPPFGFILLAMLAYEVNRWHWNDDMYGIKRTFSQKDAYRNGCLHDVRLLKDCILQDSDSCDALDNWLSKQGFKSYEDSDHKRQYLLLFFRRLYRLKFPIDDIEHWLFELENNSSFTLGVELPVYNITRDEIIN